LELVGASNNSSSSLRERSSETPETTVGHSSEPFKSSPAWDGDSDIEIDQDPPDWTKNVPEETLAALDRLEKKRQEVLNGEFFKSFVSWNVFMKMFLFCRTIPH
jgi:hypothetical protein